MVCVAPARDRYPVFVRCLWLPERSRSSPAVSYHGTCTARVRLFDNRQFGYPNTWSVSVAPTMEVRAHGAFFS